MKVVSTILNHAAALHMLFQDRKLSIMELVNVTEINAGINVYSTLDMRTGISVANYSSSPGGHRMRLCGDEVSRPGTQDMLHELTITSIKFHGTKHE